MADKFLVSWVCLNHMNYHFIICIFRWHHHLGDGYPIFRQTNSSHFTTEMIQLQILFCQKWTAWFSGSGHQIASVPLFPFARATGATKSVIPKAKNPKKGFSSSWILWKRVKVTQLLPSVPCWNPNNTYSAIFPASVLGFPLKLANYSFRKVVWVHKKNKVWPTAIPGLLNMPSLANREPPKNGIVKPVASSVLGVPTSEVIHWYTQL